MKTGETHINIHENHRRGISSTLAVLDRALCDFKRWAEGKNTRSSLYREQNRLTLSQRKKILETASEIQSEIKEIRDRLELHDHVLEVERAIIVKCEILQDDLEDLRGDHLNRYGEPDPGLTRFLDPRVQTIIQRLRELSRIAGTKTANADETGEQAEPHR